MPDLNIQTDNSLHTGYTRVLHARASTMKKSVLSLSLALVLNIKPVVAELPVPSATFVHAGDASYLVNGATGTITQNSDRAILNWQSFNVGSGNTVNFDQPGTSSIALNRIFQNDPSRILGTINANGQIYLYNQNGFIFGKGSRFNANNVVLGSLDVDEELFMESSVLNAIESQAPAFFDTTGGNNTGVINIEEGAEITAESILMVAPEILNEGNLTSTDGQTILAAAKDKVYLAASDKDSSLRGLLVEVGTGGTVTNAGNINADRGNVTLIGYAVNQNGRIRATTSVDKNGSIRLLARDGATVFENTDSNFNARKDSIGVDERPTAAYLAQSTNSGQVTLGKGSVTEVAVDNDIVTSAPDAQEQLLSKVEVVGKQVLLQEDSLIRAPSAEVVITATDSPDNPMLASNRNDSYIYMDEGSVIDVSGSDTAILPMERNSVAVELRSNELADSPLQRDGVLRGETVYVDLRKGTDLVDYSGAVAVIEKTVAERLASGGQIDIRSEGDFVQRDGALLDISGGKVTYADGFVKETKLVSDGRIINISDADKFRQYDAILGVNSKTHDRWAVTETYFSNITAANGRFVNSFVEGKSAGTVNIEAAASLLAKDGISADTIIGPYQNNADALAEQGRVNIDLKKFNDSTQAVTFTADSLVEAITDSLAKTPDAVALQRDRLANDLVLPDNYMKRNGIGELSISSNGAVVIEDSATVSADAGSNIYLTGTSVNVEGAVISHGGDVSLSSVALITGDRAELTIADDAVIDVSGLWVNSTDFVGGQDTAFPDVIDGGDISVMAEGDVTVGDGALLSASGGAKLDTDYEITAGEGGDVSLIARHKDGADLSVQGEVQSYSLTSGGTLHLEAADVLVTNEAVDAAANQLVLSQNDFTMGGFSRYEIVANAGDMVVDAALRPIMQNYGLDYAASQVSGRGLIFTPSGASITDLATIKTLADSERGPVDLQFSLAQVETDAAHNLIFTERARIDVDPGAQIDFNSDTSIYMAGKVNAKAADVSLTIDTPSLPTGYLDNQAIWLADGSVIDVSSVAVYEFDDRGLQIGEIFDAGNVALTANRGFVIIDDGALVDVSARTETVDLLVKNSDQGAAYKRFSVAPKAGSVDILAAEGIVIDGELKAQAAPVAGAEGGQLSLALDTNIRNVTVDANNLLPGVGLEKFGFDARDIVIVDAVGKRLTDDASFGDAIDSNLQGLAYLDVAEAEASGFESIRLKTDHIATGGLSAASEIRFESDVELSVDNSIVLSAPVINSNDHDVQIDAAYVSLGSDSRSRNSVATTPTKGVQDFTVSAGLVDVVGDVEITGTERVNINASDDIRFIGAQTAQTIEQLTGSLTAATDINLSSGQLYPASFSKAEINIVNHPDGVVTITGNGNRVPVLSALGSLTINAPVIDHGGVIKAPLGNIEFNASEKITLNPGSVTSVSAEGQSIPLGQTINAGGNWTYKIQTELDVVLPDKSVALNAPDIDMQTGSEVDISGGGDIFAYEFVSGPTGSADVLLPGDESGAFAILPSSESQYAPYDFLISDGLENVGRQVYLEAGNGIVAGYYTILPARYALLDGAKLVTPLQNFSTIFPDQDYSRVDGAQIHAGKYAVANSDIIDSTYSAFVVEDGSVVRTRSEYIETSANNFFSTNRPQDAGALIVQTIEKLTLASSIIGDHAPGTRGSRVDILADNIEVVADGSNIQTAGFIQLTEGNINNLEVDSLMLGGKRRIGDGETEIAVQSGDIVIRESAQISLPEILLVAIDNIELDSGSELSGTSQLMSDRSDTFVLDNNASIVGVTVNSLPTLKRTGNAAGATIDLKSGSKLAADNSIFINSINDVNLDGDLELVNGNLSIGANEVTLGNAPVSATGLNLSTQLINSLLIDQLEVNSVQSMTIYDDLALDFTNLAISAPGINARSAAGANVSLTASGDILVRQNGETALANGQGDGRLDIIAENILFDGSDEDFIFDGFSDVNMSAGNMIVSSGITGSGQDGDSRFDFSGANVVADTPLISGESGSALAIHTTGDVALINSSGITSDPAQVYDLGAELNISADSVLVDTHIVLPSGLVDVSAVGADIDDNVTLSSNGLIDVSGRTFNFVDGSQAGSSGGEIRLVSATADVNLETGSVIDVSSSDVAGDAGTIVLSAANGNVNVSGDMLVRHVDGFNGGSIRVDVDHHADLDGFLQKIQDSGFSHSQRYRVRDGDINIPGLAGDDINIVASDIVLAADNGVINVSGILDASGESAGQIALYASGDIDVSNAMLDAFAIGDSAGGEVVLATTGGALSVDATTQINVAGATSGTAVDSGKVTLRAPRTAGNTEVAINNFEAMVTGAERIDIEGVAFYNDAVIGNAQQTTYSSDAGSWLVNETAIVNRLSLATDARVHLLAGIDVSNAGDITITDELDFYQWQLASADVIDEGSLTIRAGNNLNVDASISDAVNREVLYSTSFGGFTLDGPVVPLIKDGDSWNFRLVSGADLASSAVMATRSDDQKSTGNLTLASNVIVRTGKGDIHLASGGDLVLADQTSVIYTVGQGNGTGYYTADIMDFTLLPDGPQFPSQGGDIEINVAEDIVAAVSDQYFTDWLQRMGGQISTTGSGDEIPGMWAVVLDDFEQGIATLGGGDIIVNAGGDISNISLSTPTTGQITLLGPDEVTVRGGGDITVSSGGDIRSARILADRGEAVIRARGDVDADAGGLNTLIALGDATVDIEAGGDIAIEGIGNITTLPLSTLQTNNFIKLQEGANTPYFFTYSDRTSVELLSLYGDVTLNNDLEAIKTTTSNRLVSSPVLPWSYYPGEVAATTLAGDIAINNQFTLFPEVDGDLRLMSAGDIVSREQGSTRSQVFVSVSDVAIASLPSLYEPTNNLDNTSIRLGPGTTDQSLLHDFNGPLHVDDIEPLRIAANGDIIANGELKVRSPKAAQVIAGGDIIDFGIEIQNLRATDKSIVMAGGDIRYSLPDTGSVIVSEGISVTGPGSITVLAGGDIDLGISKGIRSRGNVENFVLPDQGADIAVFAGIENNGLGSELDTSRFVATYLKGEVSADSALIDIDVAGYQNLLIDYILSENYAGDLAQSVSSITGQTYNDKNEAVVAFQSLDAGQQLQAALSSFDSSSVSEQRKLIIDIFVAELNLAAFNQATTVDDSEYARGFLAIDRLFAAPLSNTTVLTTLASLSEASRGDINLPFSRIQSTAGGDINVLAPNGELNVGFTAEVDNASAEAGPLGIVVSGKGDLSAMTEGNINVNLSRVQALDGGDISLWSSSGDIDAGRGAKTALSIPPPLTVVNKDTGQIEIIFPPSVSGSGINAGVSTAGLAPGKVTLAAPGGVVNASDAGIGSAGDLVLAATQVLGADNTSAGGASVGVPTQTNVTAGLTNLSSSTDNAVNSASQSANAAAAEAANSNVGVALVTVELLAPENDDDL